MAVVSLSLHSSVDASDVTREHMFKYTTVSSVEAVAPSAVIAEGGSVLSVMTAGVQAGTSVECRFGGTVSVVSSSVAGGVVECMSVAQAAGNASVQVSVNGQDWSAAGAAMVQVVSGMNVSSVEPSLVSVIGGSEVLIGGSGFQMEGVYCGIGGATWSSSMASVVSSTQASCVVPARGAGMRVLEVSVGGGEMSQSGVQVEYMGAARVSSVWPSTGSVSGGTVVTLAGEGFVAGVTGCRFGTSSVVMADVASSGAATCVSEAGVQGDITVEVSAVISSSIVFSMVSGAEISSVTPAVVMTGGGDSVVVLAAATPDATAVACKFGETVVVTAVQTAGAVASCRTVALPAGNASVQVSVNGQDWSAAGAAMVQVVSGMNVSSVEPSLVSVIGGSEVLIGGSGFQMEGVYCGIGGATWSSSMASVVSSTQASCVVPARGAGMRVLEVSVGGGEMSQSGVQVEYMGAARVSSVWPSTGSVSGGTVVTLAGEGFVAGVTGCRFGTSSVVMADVASSGAATCVSHLQAVRAVVSHFSCIPVIELIMMLAREYMFKYHHSVISGGCGPSAVIARWQCAVSDDSWCASWYISGSVDLEAHCQWCRALWLEELWSACLWHRLQAMHQCRYQ